MPLCTRVCTRVCTQACGYLFALLLSLPLGPCLGAELLGHSNPVRDFSRNRRCVFHSGCPFYTPSSARGPSAPRPHQHSSLCACVFDNGRLVGAETVSNSNTCLPDDQG